MTRNDFFKEAKELCGGTQSSFAEKVGLSQGAISKWERGLSDPDIRACRKLVRVFKPRLNLEQVVEITRRTHQNQAAE